MCVNIMPCIEFVVVSVCFVCSVTSIAPVLHGSEHPESLRLRLSPPFDDDKAQLLEGVAKSRSATPTYRHTSGDSEFKPTTHSASGQDVNDSYERDEDKSIANRRGEVDGSLVIPLAHVPLAHTEVNTHKGVDDERRNRESNGTISGTDLNSTEHSLVISQDKNNSLAFHMSNDTELVGNDTGSGNDTGNDVASWKDAGSQDKSNIFDFLRIISAVQFTWIDIILTVLCTTALVLLCVNVALLTHYCRKHQRFSPAFAARGGARFNDSLQIRNEKFLVRRACLGWGNCRKFTTNVAFPESSPIGASSVDHMIANFVSDELIGELNDRDSTCTSVSDGFVFSRSYDSAIACNTAATIF